MANKSKHDKEISIGDIEKQMRLLNSGVYINHLKKWANDDQDVNDKMIKEALQILEDVILGEYKDDFLVKVSAGEIFYRARTISIDDYGNVEKGLHISKDRLFRDITGKSQKNLLQSMQLLVEIVRKKNLHYTLPLMK